MKTSQEAVEKEKRLFPTKILVRRLPPTLSSETFLEEVSPLPEHNYFSYVSADKSLGQFAFCRAVINFKDPDDVILFKEKFDDYVFVDPKGNEYPAVVEFAPYQKIPLATRKQDHRENSIDNDPDYKRFVESLENPEPPPVISVKDILEEVDARAKEKQAAISAETPLIAFINKFKLEKKRMQEKLREEKRLREQEKRRQKDEERRQRKDREKKAKEAASATSEGKKSSGKEDSKSSTSARPNKAETSKSNAKQDSAGKSGDKTTKSKPSYKDKDDVIVRTIPSKTKSYEGSKGRRSAEKSRPSKGPASASKPRSTDADQHKPATSSNTGKGERKSADKTEAKPVKLLSKDVSNSDKQESSSGTMAKVKPTKDAVPGATSSVDRTKSEKPQRTVSTAASNTPTAEDKEKAEDEKSCAVKGAKRYKDRPARAIYNPAAKAAERRQKQAKSANSTEGNDNSTSKPSTE